MAGKSTLGKSVAEEPIVLARREEIVDARVGIVKYLQEVPRRPGAPNFFHFQALASDTSAFGANANFRFGGGASLSRAGAMVKALGETVERYSAAIYDKAEFPLFSYAEAPGPAVSPPSLALYSEEQYSGGFLWTRFSADTQVRWCLASDMSSGERVYAPACRIVLPYAFDVASGEAAIDQPMSTGLACHETLEKASINAICEVVERDAFSILWQRGVTPMAIDPTSLDGQNSELRARFTKCGYEVDLFSIRMDHSIPTCLSVLRGTNPEQPPAVFAAASALSPETALQKSLEELAHTRSYCDLIYRSKPRLERRFPRFDNVTNQESHLNFYLDRQHGHVFGFLYDNPETIQLRGIENLSTGDETTDLRRIIELIAGVNERVLICDLTTPDVAEVGLSVVRAFVPGFHPLRIGHEIRALGGSRLWRVPEELGHRCKFERTDNPYPHPYP
jgi:ribosomal protein S12 methylthiotransferase accessory factor